MIQQLEEFSGRINKKCKEVLAITSNPIRFAMEGTKVSELLDGVHLELLLLGNFMEAYSNLNKKEGEENGESEEV